MKKLFITALFVFFTTLCSMAGCHVEVRQMPCKLLAGIQQRDYVVCLPADYDTSGKSYPVLYLLHGGGCPSTQWIEFGKLQQVVDQLTASGEMTPMIIICAEANEGGKMIWFNEPEWTYEDYFFKELIPYVEQNYRVDTRRSMRSVAGFSMGGGGSVGYGLRHPEMFNVVYAMSAYLRRQPLDFLKNDPLGEWRQQNVERHNPIKIVENGSESDVTRWKQIGWFIDCGDQDFTLEGNMDFVKALRQKQIPYEMRVLSGGHEWGYWRRGLEDAIKYVSKSIRETVCNPMAWADLPDPDVIRVGEYYYLVTTTMHLMPGAPVMRSKDLVNWETVSYIFDRLTDSPKYDLDGSPEGAGTAYGRGQWATSLKYHKGRFYALLAPNEAGATGDTYIFSTDDPTTKWTLQARLRHFHDASLFFDDDDRVYVVYGTGEMCELKSDFSGVVEGSNMKIFEREADETGLLEGSRMIKHNGKYYLLMISHVYAPGRHRREVCYRADNIRGPYEKNVILESDFGGFSHAGQGTIVDSQNGEWYGVIFQDRGGVGRVLTLMPCRWINGWPMLGDFNGRIPTRMKKPVACEPLPSIVRSDDFDSPSLGLHWQWNHNPVDGAWSLTERQGALRLKTSRVVPNLYLAPNTITQRMEGPQCSGVVELDLSHLRDGDCAGLSAFNGQSGVLTVRKNGRRMELSMSEQEVQLGNRDKHVQKVDENVVETVTLKQPKIWLRVDADFMPRTDMAVFSYSLDGQTWTQIGTPYKMRFDYRKLFMGSKFAIFCYATKQTGGYLDVLSFNYKND